MGTDISAVTSQTHVRQATEKAPDVCGLAMGPVEQNVNQWYSGKGLREREFSFHKNDMNSYYIGDRRSGSYMHSGELVCMEHGERSRNETLRLQRFGRSTGCYDITPGRSKVD
jgi:hypothetical protein